MGVEFHEAINFGNFCQLKHNNRGKGASGSSWRLMVGRLYLCTFDGSSKCTARAWVEKLDTYFHLNQMLEVETIKLAVLHLEGDAHD